MVTWIKFGNKYPVFFHHGCLFPEDESNQAMQYDAVCSTQRNTAAVVHTKADRQQLWTVEIS